MSEEKNIFLNQNDGGVFMHAKKVLKIEKPNISLVATSAPVSRPGILGRIAKVLFRPTETFEDFERLEGLKPARSKDYPETHRAYWVRF